MLREAACLQLAERLFQSFAPLNEKDFLPFSVPIFGNLRSVDVLRSLYEVLCEFFLNKLRKYGGASSFKLLKTIVLDSMSINSLALYSEKSRTFGQGFKVSYTREQYRSRVHSTRTDPTQRSTDVK